MHVQTAIAETAFVFVLNLLFSLQVAKEHLALGASMF